MPQPAGLLAEAVLRTADARSRYRDRFGVLFTNVLQPAVITRRIDQAVSLLVPALKNYNPSLAARFAENAAGLKDRVVARAAGLEKQLNPPKPLRFDHNAVIVRGWKMGRRQGSAVLDEGTEDGRPVLKIGCDGVNSNGSWRALVLLEPGRYRFSGKVRALGIVPRDDSPVSGGFLRISRSRGGNGVLGDVDWTAVQQDFSIEETQREITLVCELHALKGEIWFDKESLRLERLP